MFPLSPHAGEEAKDERIILEHSYYPTESYTAWRFTEITVETMEKSGSVTPIESLRQIPIFVGTTATENDSNGGNGAAFIDLYALGANNVLTLINGRRAFGFTDVNAIPMSALSRTEILSQGVVYGSDSAAGVVNFIMLNGPGEKPYEGAELGALYGNTTETDAHVRQVYLRGGIIGMDGKVSIAAVGEYYSRANLFSRDREISSTADLSNDSTGLGLGGTNNNSPTYGGRISVGAGATALGFTNTGQLVLGDLTTNQVTPGSYRHFDNTLDPSEFNFRAFTPAIPAMEKAMYYVTGRYKIFGEDLQLYGDIMYSKVKQDNAIAGIPFALTTPANGILEARSSPFNPAGNFLNSVRYRLQEPLGLGKSFFDKDYWRYEIGINGDFYIKDNDFISRLYYDSGFVYSRLDQERIDSGDATRSGIRAAIAGSLVPGVLFNPFIGEYAPLIGNAPTYVNGIPTGQVAPYNNIVTAQAASYIGHSFSYERDSLFDGKVSAHLFPKLWNGGFDIAIGAENRETQPHQLPDAIEAGGDQIRFTASPNTKFKQEVDSFFADLLIPIITSTMKVWGIRSLEVESLFRYETFDTKDQYSHTTATFEDSSGSVSLRYQPSPDIMLRASWQQSNRPPTFDDQFARVTQTFPPIFFDPPFPPFGPPGGVFARGNTKLSPEKTEAYSAGVVWSPTIVAGLTITADWYQLFTDDLIVNSEQFVQVLLENRIIAPITFENLPSPNFDPCGAPNNIGIVGNPAEGFVDCINSHPANAGKRLVQGLEMTATYEIPTERFGKFTFAGGWNHFFTWKAQPGYGDSNSFLGNYDNGTLPFGPGAIPWNKGFLRGEWEWNHFDVIATVNYVGDFRDDKSFNGDQFGVGGPDYSCTNPQNPNQPFCPPGVAGLGDFNIGRLRTVASYTTLDMQLSYEFVKPVIDPAPVYAKDSKDSKNVMQATSAETSSLWQRMLWGTKLTVGINNAFDRSPPTVLAAPNDNYDTSLYTIRNRFWYASFEKRF